MDYQLFSADDHIDLCYLPEDLWQTRVDPAYRDRAPRIGEVEGRKRWVAGGLPFGGMMGVIPKPGDMFSTFGKGAVVVEQEEGRWRATTPELRLKDMDSDGVAAHVLYGPFNEFQFKDPVLNTMCLQAFNDWMAEFASASPGRFVGIAILPVHEVEAAVAELLRCAELGFKAVQFHALVAYRHHWDEVWEPLWAAAAGAGVAISFHLSSAEVKSAGFWSCRNVEQDPPGRGLLATAIAAGPSRIDEVLCELIYSGIMKRHPRLRVVLAECGIGWIPYLLERMDRKYAERHASKRHDAADLDMPPSGYYQRQMYATFQEDPVGVKLLELIGPGTAMWASDYPHTDSVWPESHATVDGMFQGVDSKISEMVLRENARALYG